MSHITESINKLDILDEQIVNRKNGWYRTRINTETISTIVTIQRLYIMIHHQDYYGFHAWYWIGHRLQQLAGLCYGTQNALRPLS